VVALSTTGLLKALGFSPGDVYMMTYGGVPTTVEGLKVCKKVLVERGLWQED